MPARSPTAVLTLAMVMLAAEAFPYAAGIVGYSGSTAGVTCSQCHVATGAAPTVAITGPAALAPGATGNYVLTLTGGPGVRGGMNVGTTAAGAQLKGDGTTTKASAGEVTHTASRAFSGGSVTFNFQLVAPTTPGTVMLYGAGNSCNGTGGSAGDHDATTTLAVVVSSANQAPTIAAAAAASPATVTGTATGLTAMAADDQGEAALSYTWASTGPAAVSFSANGTNAAKSVTATFSRAGVYTFTVTARDAAGLTASSSTSTVVQAALLALAVAPATVGLAPGATQAFTASGSDQFGNPVTVNPAWSASGGGTISTGGVFTAGATPGGPHTITATSGSLSATAVATISAGSPPSIAAAAKALPGPVVGKTAALSVLGADDGGEAGLNYTWSASGPSPVTFSVNGTNGAKSTIATFVKAGAYTLTVTLKDAQSLTTTSAVAFTVDAVPALLMVAPGSVTVGPGTTTQFTITSEDQFGQVIAPAPAAAWSTTGGGTVSPNGLFIAASAAGGPFTISAAVDALTATAQLTISASAAPTIAAAPSATPTIVTGRTTLLRVLGSDSAGETGLAYHWGAAGAAVAFSANDSNAAKATTATFGGAGTVHLTVTATNALGKSVAATLDVVVSQSLSVLALDPPSATVPGNGLQQFRATQLDQFGLQLLIPAEVSWAVAGGGTIGADGIFTARATSGGPFLLSATAAGVRGTALVTVDGVGGPSSAGDVQAPTVQVMTPASGGELSGQVMVQVDARDEVGVAKVQLLLDGSVVAESTMAPWSLELDTTALPDGAHQLGAVAIDAAGNVAHSPVMQVLVHNGQGAQVLTTVSDVKGTTLGCSASLGALAWMACAVWLPPLLRRRRVESRKGGSPC